MKLIALLTGLIEILSRLFEAYGSKKREQERTEYERKIDAIDSDPVDYANDKFRVRPPADKDTRDLPGNAPSDTTD